VLFPLFESGTNKERKKFLVVKNILKGFIFFSNVVDVIQSEKKHGAMTFCQPAILPINKNLFSLREKELH
jgi:hypothetical protein